MKIKEICRKTGLTEKAVRYYVENGLCSPREYESRDRRYLDFTEQNLAELRDVATLRKLGFSIDDIRLMKSDGRRVGEIMSSHVRSMAEELDVKTRIYSSLSAIDCSGINSFEELMPAVSGILKPDPADPDFSKFENGLFDDGADGGAEELSPKKKLTKILEIFITYSAVIGTLAALTTLPGLILLIFAALISRRFRADYMSMYQVLTGVGFLSSAIAFVRSLCAAGGVSDILTILWGGAPEFTVIRCRLYFIIAAAELASLLILIFGRDIRENF